MSKKVERNYLENNFIKEFKENSNFPKNYSINLVDPFDFQLNKFFYKNIGKNHHWVDRLVWTEKQWINYVSDKKVKTYVLKNEKEFAGYFELILHEEKDEVEIAYLGLLDESQNKKLGSFLLSSAIQNSFLYPTQIVWVHTFSLDHHNAFNNSISRRLQLFTTAPITISINFVFGNRCVIESIFRVFAISPTVA